MRLNDIYRKDLINDSVAFVRGWAKIVGTNTVQVGDQACKGAHILIATGSEVSIFIRQDTVLTHFDQTIQQVLTRQMEQHSVSIVQDPNRNNSAV